MAERREKQNRRLTWFAICLAAVAFAALATAVSPALAFDTWSHSNATVATCAPGCHSNAAAPSDVTCAGCHSGFASTPGSNCWTCHAPGQDTSDWSSSSAGCSATCHLSPPVDDECGSCHDVNNYWKPFTHGATPHAGADVAPCLTCHQVSVSASDPGGSPHHGGAAPPASDCAGCHDGVIASAKVNHDGITDCETCHTGMDIPAVPATCNACHEALTYGIGTCTNASCHGTEVIHTETPSATATCTDCHTDKTSGHYETLGTCTDCHTDVARAHHIGGTGVPDCAGCHSAKVSHDGVADCESCHTGMDIPPVPATCNTCHTPAEVGTGTCTAAGCHGSGVIHNETPSAVTACTDCHADKTSGHYETLGECADCHTDVAGYHHAGTPTIPLDDCRACHDGGIASDRVVHDGLQSCAMCHDGMDRPAQTEVCNLCHFKVTAATTPTCTSCHSESGMFGREQIHDAEPTAGATCADCHRAHYTDVGSCSTCHPGTPRMHHDGSLLTDSSVTLSADVAEITFGDPATLSGVLTSGDLPTPFEQVTLQQMTAAPGVFENVTTLTTGPDGTFTAKVGPLELTTYRVLWMGAESAYSLRGPAAADVTVAVRPVVSLKLTNARSVSGRYSMYPKGRAVKVSGRVLPAHPSLQGDVTDTVNVSGYRYRFSKKLGRKTWVRVIRVQRSIGSDGRFSWSWKPTSRGKFRVVVNVAADGGHLSAKSVYRYFKVY